MPTKAKRLFGIRGMIPLELLLSVCLVGGLLLMVTILIDKSLAIQHTRDILRVNHVQLIMGSILQYQVDNGGAMPAVVHPDPVYGQMIVSHGQVCTNECPNHPVSADCIDFSALSPKYLDAIPQDPFFTSLGPSGYYIHTRGDGDSLIVGACVTETTSVIEASR
jgi:hypothetical protein